MITTIVAIISFAAGYAARALYSRYRRRRWRRAQEQALKEVTAQQVLTALRLKHRASSSASGQGPSLGKAPPNAGQEEPSRSRPRTA
jgi:hypothetical protein